MLSIPCLIVATVLLLGGIDMMLHFRYAVLGLRRFERQPAFLLQHPGALPDHEPLSLPTPQGDRVRGTVFLPDGGHCRGVVLFCPEARGSSLSAMCYASALVEAGFTVVSIDFRSQLQSDRENGARPVHWVTEQDVDDVCAALEFIEGEQRFSGLPIGMFGVSRGAAAALIAGAKSSRVERIVAQGAFSTRTVQLHYARRYLEQRLGSAAGLIPDWHVKITMWLTRVFSQWRWKCRYVHLEEYLPAWRDRDVLFISGGRDSYIPCEHAREICRRTGHDPRRSHWVVPGAKHNRERSINPAEYDARIVPFFSAAADRALPRQTTTVS